MWLFICIAVSSCKYVSLPLWPRRPQKRDFNINESFKWLNKGLMHWGSANSALILPALPGRFHEFKQLFLDWYFRYGADGRRVLTNIGNTPLSVNRTHVVYEKKVCFVGEWSRGAKNVRGKLTPFSYFHVQTWQQKQWCAHKLQLCFNLHLRVVRRNPARRLGGGGHQADCFHSRKRKKMSSFRSWRLDKKRLCRTSDHRVGQTVPPARAEKRKQREGETFRASAEVEHTS